MTWVKVKEITGGQLVHCELCGRKVCRETFWASDTNYAEAFRLATAFAWHHEHSAAHHAALDAFHSGEVPDPTEEEILLAKIFGDRLPSRSERRLSNARNAAHRTIRESDAS